MLREFLISRFDLGELEVLCFDLAIDYDILPHRTRIELADGLIEHCASLGQLRHLASTALARRPGVADGPALAAQLDQLPTVPATRVRVQVTLDLDMKEWGDRPMREVVDHIARLGGVARMEIHALSALPGSVRLLLGVPETVLPRLLAAPMPQLANGRWRIVRIDPFYALPPAMQAAWQTEFRSRAPGRDADQRKLNFPKKRGCLGAVIGGLALVALAFGGLVVVGSLVGGLTPLPPSPRTATPPPAPSSTPAPTPTPADKTSPIITNLKATPLQGNTKACPAVNAIAITANVSDERGLELVEVHYLFRAKPNKGGDSDPKVSTPTYLAGGKTAGGAKSLAYNAVVDLARHDKELSGGNYPTWMMEYWIVATDTSNNSAESKHNLDVTVFTICGPI